MREPSFTLTAGPTAATPRTLQALGQPIIFDYDPVFLEKFRALERKVGELMRSSDDIVLMQGEAVLGLEAAARALTRPGMKALNLVSGVYAAWFGDWLREYGAEVVEVRVPYDEAVDAADVRQALADNPDVELVAVVQSETPSGIHNPVAEIAPAVKEAGALLLVDAVSALGCEEVLVDEWGIDVCVVGPQKCLAGPPGMSLISVSAAAWEAMERNPNAPRGSFLSLLDWKERWVDTDRTKFLYTPSVVDVNGVDSVVDQVLEEGLDSCIARHQTAARAVRAGAQAMGLELWPRREDYAAGCVTAIRVPEGISRAGTLEHIRERYGVMLSGGYGELADKLFRIGHMGPAADSMNPVVAVAALGRGLKDLGAEVSIGAGVEATLEKIGEAAERAVTPA
jgi:pyridoxamine---pyruvate transaminase